MLSPRVLPSGSPQHGDVDAQVHQEGGAADEGLPTVAALVGLLSCVDPLVLGEGGALRKGLRTNLALVWLLPRVDPQVPDQS